MKTKNVKTPAELLAFMDENIRYGWLDPEGREHIKCMKDFRRDYRTASLEQCLEHGIGTCIEQVFLMHTVLDKIGTPNKMFCCRIYEGADYNDLEEDEHMHCFLLYYENGRVYHLEHPNWEKAGIYEYPDEAQAIRAIEQYYTELRGGKPSPTTQFYTVQPGLTFRGFNLYINSLDGAL